MALRAIADHGKGIIFEVPVSLSITPPSWSGERGDILLEPVQWPVGPLVNDLLGACKVESFDPSDGLASGVSNARRGRMDDAGGSK